jgi:DNA polymerase-3 subunit alpha/error-prone DNA polymerase
MHSRLGIRSSFSLLWGTNSPKSIINYLSTQGCKTISITDRDNLYGLHEIRQEAASHHIKMVIGVQLVVGKESIFAFVRTKRGYSRLCTILSRRQQEVDFDYMTALTTDTQGLILATASPSLLKQLAKKVVDLYGAITPYDWGVISTARKLSLPLVAIDDATFLKQEDHQAHAVLRSIDLGKTVGMLTQEQVESSGHTILSASKYTQAFSSWPEAVKASDAIADVCADIPLFDSFVFPAYPVADSNPQQELRKRVLLGAERRYGELSDAILGRIDYEMDIIVRKGFAPYFLVMDDIVSMASRTCGRGSGAASIVSYALGITNVDPIAHNLYFERFLTMARTDPPDIDVDFAWDERDEILQEVIRRFGREHCARVANHNRFRFRSALRETAKAYGIPDSDITRVERKLYESGLSTIEDPLWHTIGAIATRIEGLPRGLSMHCGGMVITPDRIETYVPVEKSAEGYPLLAWEKEGTEAAGLVKIDLLGNRSLAVIRDALQNLREQGIEIDEQTWRPVEDSATIAALSRGDSIGVFYIESPAMRQLQKKTGRGDFAHIVIHSSIIRPAANAFINEYVRRLKGEAWDPLHPLLASILDETYGILCYQEDVSKTAVALAGFNEADADALRKVIAKKASGEKLDRYREEFFNGCREHQVKEETIVKIWEMMLSFEGYSFCKPHSASYAMVSFQSAFLRVHYPAAFMAAVLSNGGGYYVPQAYISEARRMGLWVQGPDINQSRFRYHAEGSSIIIGFMAIANLSKSAVTSILQERKRDGDFVSLEEAASRLSLQRDDYVSLVAAGVFDSLAPTTPRSDQIRRLLTTKTAGRDEKSSQGLLFNVETSPTMKAMRTEVQQIQKGKTEAELRREFEALGFLRQHHPLMLWAGQIARIPRIRAMEMASFKGKQVSLLGWPITRKTVWTKQGLPMDFISFEDESALYETILFPQLHEKYRKLLYSQRPLLIRGTVSDDMGALYVEINAISPIMS